MPATKDNLSKVEELKKAAADRAAQELVLAKEMKTKVEALSVRIERAVGEENKMYGSVTTKDIEEAFTVHGVALDRRKIQLVDPIKILGLAEVPIKLHADVVATLRVEVIKAKS